MGASSCASNWVARGRGRGSVWRWSVQKPSYNYSGAVKPQLLLKQAPLTRAKRKWMRPVESR